MRNYSHKSIEGEYRYSAKVTPKVVVEETGAKAVVEEPQGTTALFVPDDMLIKGTEWLAEQTDSGNIEWDGEYPQSYTGGGRNGELLFELLTSLIDFRREPTRYEVQVTIYVNAYSESEAEDRAAEAISTYDIEDYSIESVIEA